MDLIEQFSAGLADRVAAAAPFVVGVHTGRRPSSGILWRPDVVVMSEQMLPEEPAELQVMHAGQAIDATLAGRDPGTNVAVLKLATPLAGRRCPQPLTEPYVSATGVAGRAPMRRAMPPAAWQWSTHGRSLAQHGGRTHRRADPA